MSALIRLILSVTFLFIAAPSLAAILIDAPRVSLEGHLSATVDHTKNWSIEQALASESLFRPLEGNLKREAVDSVVWLRFTLKNQRTDLQEYWLEIDPAMLERLDLYVALPDGRLVHHAAGSTLPFNHRAVAYRNPVFKLELPAAQDRTFYLRLDSGMWQTAKLTVWEPSTFLSAVAKEQLAFGLYIGIYILLVISSLWFERVMRDGVYFCFALYVFGCVFITLTSTGLWQQYVMPNSPSLIVLSYAASFAFMMGACIQFFFVFVGMHRLRPKTTQVCLYTMWTICGSVTIASAIGYHRYALYVFNLTIIFAILPITAYLLWKPALQSRNEIRLIFVLGGFQLLVSYLYVSAVSNHLLPSSWLSSNVMYLSSMSFFLIVFYAVSRRYYALRVMQEMAQRELLQLSHRSEKELQKLVVTRTLELERAKHSAESALSHAHAVQQEQRQFIATVSHELRTPLAVIDAVAQNLAREIVPDPDKSRNKANKIRQATKRLSVLFDDYLNDERFEQFSRGASPQMTPLLPLFRDAIEASKTLSDQHRILVEAEVSIEVWADPHSLRLTLRTLVDNAVKYSPPGCTVVLSVEELDGGWHIDVKDNGPVIPEDERARIFERYYRGRASSNRIGTGLGLSLANRFAEQHQGSLKLFCPLMGGNLFRLYLPKNIV